MLTLTVNKTLVNDVIEERSIGGVDFALLRTPAGYMVEETIMGDVYQDESYDSEAEARFAFEVKTGMQVAQAQDYGADYDGGYGAGAPIGYYESTRPWEY